MTAARLKLLAALPTGLREEASRTAAVYPPVPAGTPAPARQRPPEVVRAVDATATAAALRRTMATTVGVLARSYGLH